MCLFQGHRNSRDNPSGRCASVGFFAKFRPPDLAWGRPFRDRKSLRRTSYAALEAIRSLLRPRQRTGQWNADCSALPLSSLRLCVVRNRTIRGSSRRDSTMRTCCWPMVCAMTGRPLRLHLKFPEKHEAQDAAQGIPLSVPVCVVLLLLESLMRLSRIRGARGWRLFA